jgi:hypothetical protein
VAGTDAGTGPDVIEITGMDSAEVGRLAAAHGIALSELIPVRASLEEAFMELTRESVEYQAAGVPRAPFGPIDFLGRRRARRSRCSASP